VTGGRTPLRIAVLMGGPSGEREVSLRSGEAVLAALRSTPHETLRVEVAADGRWLLPGSAPSGAAAAAAPGGGALVPVAASAALAGDARRAPVDVVLLALHGAWGEDGTVQGLLEAAGVPYTGSGVLASALAMDKERAKILVSAAGLRVPRGAAVDRAAFEADPAGAAAAAARASGLPAFVKPCGGGSSQGAGPAATEAEVADRLRAAFAAGDDRALVEERLAGTEVTCAVLGNRGGPYRTLPLVEIVPRGGRAFFDYEAKYAEGGSDEICPARVPAAVAARVAEASVAAHRALGCDGMSRSDFILADGAPCYLETNTIPGMTEASLCPKAARAAGIAFPELLELMVDMALRRPRAGRGGAKGGS
jgi:D-alanine-D-alanine ligase